MESSTTDVCEWCKRPMLPPGAQVTGQTKPVSAEAQEAAEPPGRSLGEVTGADASGQQEPTSEEAKLEAELRPLGGHGEQAQQAESPASPPPAAAPPTPPASAEPPQAAEPASPAPTEAATPSASPASPAPTEAAAPSASPASPAPTEAATPSASPASPAPPELDSAAEPQEPQTGEPEKPQASDGTAPTHGLADEATATSIDISQYTGDDDSIFRPIVREEANAEDTRDLLQQKHRRKLEEARGPEIPENTRLLRCLIAGLVIAVPVALLQYFITGDTATVLFSSVPLARSSSFISAVKYGIASGVVFGFGIGALLVRLKKGPGLGFLVGLLVGLGVGNGIWAVIPGIIVGIYAGKAATFGVRQVVNV
jgi:hypothetical protein